MATTNEGMLFPDRLTQMSHARICGIATSLDYRTAKSCGGADRCYSDSGSTQPRVNAFETHSCAVLTSFKLSRHRTNAAHLTASARPQIVLFFRFQVCAYECFVYALHQIRQTMAGIVDNLIRLCRLSNT